MSEKFLNDKVELYLGDCLDVLATLPENSIDSCVTDPPYHLTSIVKRFATVSKKDVEVARANPHRRTSSGFMGKQWDGGDIAFRPETWAAVYRVLKPGAHLVAFGGTRTYHRMACAIEDAGFEIRDQIQWLYGSGFPKSHDVSKGIDRALGKERKKIRINISNVKNPPNLVGGANKGDDRPWRQEAIKNGFHEAISDEAISDEAISYQGWGTALKPACEPIVLARKPLSEKTVAANVLKWGTGALNIDGCRVGILGGTAKDAPAKRESVNAYGNGLNGGGVRQLEAGRWPANVIHDGSEEVVNGFPDEAGGSASSRTITEPNYKNQVYGSGSGIGGIVGSHNQHDDEGSAARFFYTAKADANDRIGSKHPTVKPLDLMQYLVRLVCPRNGVVVDPFAGTGTMGEAAWREGCRAVLIEREAEYQADIRRRMKLALTGPDERTRESIKARGLVADAGPLFGGQSKTRGGADRFTEYTPMKNTQGIKS